MGGYLQGRRPRSGKTRLRLRNGCGGSATGRPRLDKCRLKTVGGWFSFALTQGRQTTVIRCDYERLVAAGNKRPFNFKRSLCRCCPMYQGRQCADSDLCKVVGPFLEAFILRGITLTGINADSPVQMRKRIWQRLANDLKPAGLSDWAKLITLEDVPSVMQQMLNGRTTGRNVVTFEKTPTP